MAGYGVGGAAASGVQAGFDMGLRMDDAAERKRIAGVAEQRNASLDAERQAQTARTNARQDKIDAENEDDRALKALDTERQDHAFEGAGLAQQYGGPDKIPGDVGSAYATKAGDIGTRRAALLRRKYAPVVEKEQQWARDTASRIQTGQASMDDLSPVDMVRLLQATTRRPVTDFLRAGGTSKVGQGVADTTAGMKTKNQGLVLQGAGVLLSPELQTGLGHTTSDGSEIVRKELYALVPSMPQPGGLRAPAPQGNPVQGLSAALSNVMSNAPPEQPPQEQPPNAVMPVLRVTARHSDGTEVAYMAPVTKGRGTGVDDTVHPGIQLSEAMDQVGKLGALEAWANTPAARTKIEQGLKELGGGANSFLGAYYAMHGDAKALLPPGAEDPTSKKIAAVQKLAKELGIPFADAMRQFDGKTSGGAIQQKLDAIDASGLSDAEKTRATKIALMGGVKGAGVGGGGSSGGSAGTGINANLTHAVKGLSKEQNNALFGERGAVTEGRLDPGKINSKTASIFADAELTSPGTDYAKMSGDIALGRNPTFRTKAIVAETLPSVMRNMVEAGKKLKFSGLKRVGQVQAFIKGELNDPEWVYYMVHRNDALMTIANVMRGIGMSDQAHRAEMEVTAPTMSPDALDAWFKSQMAALQPRLDLNRKITEGGSAAAPRSRESGQPAPPAVGTVQQGYRFKGGNPADKANWERVQ